MIYDEFLKFGSRYQLNYDPKKSYVIMDDYSITEQSGYKSTSELYEEMIRAGRILRANRLEMTYDELLEHEDELGSFETRYELDLVEQQEILEKFKRRVSDAVQQSKEDGTYHYPRDPATEEQEKAEKILSKEKTEGETK